MSTRGHHGLLLGAGGGVPPDVSNLLHIELYTGNGSGTRSIPGVDLSAGGMSLFRNRGAAAPGAIYSATGSSPQQVLTNSSAAGGAAAANFDASGTNLTANTYNTNLANFVNWSFKKSPRFFDIVTYTGTGAAHSIAHNLGVEPAMMWVKQTGGSSDWALYQRDLGNTGIFRLNSTAGVETNAAWWNNTSPTAGVFTVGTQTAVNALGGSYVAFLFAHDTASDGVIKGFTYTGNSGATGPAVNLGWDPQFVMLAALSTRHILDQTRSPGFTGSDAFLTIGSNNSETSADLIQLTGTGFEAVGTGSATNTNARVYYGLAIREP